MQRNMAHLRSLGLSKSFRQRVCRERGVFGSTYRLSSNVTHLETNTPKVEHLQIPLSQKMIPKSAGCELVKALENIMLTRGALGITDEVAHSYSLNMQQRQEEHELTFQLTKEQWRRDISVSSNETDAKNPPSQPTKNTTSTNTGPVEELESLIRRKREKAAMDSFRNYTLPPVKECSLRHFAVYKKLIKLMAPALDPSYEIFLEFESLITNFENSEGNNIEEKTLIDYHMIRGDILQHMVSILGAPVGHWFKDRQKYEAIVRDIISRVCSLPQSELKYHLIPKLMNSLLCGKGNWGKVREMEIRLWEYMFDSVKEDPSFIFDENLFRFEKILEHTNYRSQMALPFVELLLMVVNEGARPKPEIVLNVLHNEFPFLKMNNVGNLLRTIIQLEKANLSKKSGFNYQVDLGTLEHLSATAAKKGRSDVILLVWEYMEVMRLSEENSNCITLSQSMHESAAQAFACSSKKEDHMIFNLFAEMDEQGYETNRALLKSISRSMRTRVTVRRIDNMKWILKNHGKNDNYYNTSKPTSAALNCILACYGQLGEVQKALETFDEFDHLGCQTTPETFEFIMEGIRENTTTAVPPFLHGIGTNYVGNENEDNFEEWRLSQLETAEVVLLTCLEQGHQVNMYMLNNYIQILCTAGELQKAKEFLSELIESEKEHVQEFSPQCFSILALSYAQRGFRDETQEVINMCTEVGLSDHFPKHVMERIATL